MNTLIKRAERTRRSALNFSVENWEKEFAKDLETTEDSYNSDTDEDFDD